MLLDVRSAAVAKKGFIKGAVTLPATDVAANIGQVAGQRTKNRRSSIVDDKGGETATNAAKALIAAGYTNVAILTGGMDAWQAGEISC